MKTILILFACLVTLPAWAAHVRFDYTDARLNALGTRNLILYPLAVAETAGGKLVSKDRISTFTGTNSSTTVSNLLGGFYQGEFKGPFRTTTNYFVLPTTNGTIAAADWLASYLTNGNQVFILSAATVFTLGGDVSAVTATNAAITAIASRGLAGTNAPPLYSPSLRGTVLFGVEDRVPFHVQQDLAGNLLFMGETDTAVFWFDWEGDAASGFHAPIFYGSAAGLTVTTNATPPADAAHPYWFVVTNAAGEALRVPGYK